MLEHIRSIPYTSSGLNLILTAKQEEKCRVLYKHIKDDLYEFAGFYDPEKEDADYPDGMLELPMGSVFGGSRLLSAGTRVWNVINSSDDPKPQGMSWIDMWMMYLGKTKKDKKCYVKGSAGIICNRNIYGGHMVLQECNISPKHGSDGVVYIIPICNAHNNKNNTAEMILSEDVEAMVLNKYYQRV